MGQVNWGVWLAVIFAGIQAVYTVLGYYRDQAGSVLGVPSMRHRYMVMGIFLLLTWAAVGWDYYDRRFSSQNIAEDFGLLKGWGLHEMKDGLPYRVYAVADGARLQRYQSAYRVAAVCFHNWATQDVEDISDLQKSALYDIRNGDVLMVFPLSDKFIDEWRNGARGTTYHLLLVPKKMTTDQFSTLRQARESGVLLLAGGADGP